MSTRPLPLPEEREPRISANGQLYWVAEDQPQKKMMQVQPWLFWLLVGLVGANMFFDILFGIFLFSVNMR